MEPKLDTKRLAIAQYISTILTIIRREYTKSIDEFRAVIQSGIIVQELEDNWDYYHMYDYRETAEELKKFEPLIQA
ncbi:MAG: hypothetical protein FWD27_09305 [Coriobacteriia bacterium]|nr:hypothetical protein [Coriobacteriia bacterium]